MAAEQDQLGVQETPQKQAEQLSLVQVEEAVELQILYQMQLKQHQAEVQVAEVQAVAAQRMEIKTEQELAP